MIMIGDRIRELRTQNRYTMEEFSEKLGVSRQTLSKWELGDTIPDLERSMMMANMFRITLDELVYGSLDRSDEESGKYVFGIVELDGENKIVIPKDAREVFELSAGDKMLMVGDSKQGMALVKMRNCSE